MILTAHFLKSVCFEIGSVASSVTLLMSWLASKNGKPGQVSVSLATLVVVVPRSRVRVEGRAQPEWRPMHARARPDAITRP